ncbi:hypothetical protein RB195_018083 [Necator americanus]|uniref:DEP domain-containing protein n=1 Tax=Necator americanus TaxID=51031 RepID=A0ABR1C952_NECAM
MSKNATPLNRVLPSRSSDKTCSKYYSRDCPGTHSGKYRATTLWNNIVRHFRDEMPIKRHRRQLTYYEASFTGKEAVDFLMVLLPRLIFEGREVDRSNCITLLQKFVDQGFIKKARPNPSEKDVFRDNASLYVFVDDCALFGISRTPRLVRTSSCHDESHRQSRTPPKLSPCYSSQSPCEFAYRKVLSPHPSGFSRRMSSSHGNLLSLLPPSNKLCDSADSIAETIDSRRVEVNFNLRVSPHKDCSTPVVEPRRVKGRKKNRSPHVKEAPKSLSKELDRIKDEGAYEWLSFVRRKRPEQPKKNKKAQWNSALPSSPNVGNENRPEFEDLLDHNERASTAKLNIQAADNIYARLQVTQRRLTEVDLWSVWRNCLLARLRRILNVEDLSFITWEVVGQNVKWNCQRIGSSGVVKARTDREDFSGFITRLMRYLEQFPFPSGSANVIIYKENQEVNVFKTVCSRLSREDPALSYAETLALIHVLSCCSARKANVCEENKHVTNHRSSLHIETEFTEDAPRSRVVPRCLSTTLTHRICSSSSTNSSISSLGEHIGVVKANNEPSFKDDRRVLQTLQEDLSSSTNISCIYGPAAGRGHEEQRNKCLWKEFPEDVDILKLPGLRRAGITKELDEFSSISRSVDQLSDRLSATLCWTDSVDLPDFAEPTSEHPQYSLDCSSSASSYKTANLPTVKADLNDRSLQPSSVLLEALSLILLSLPPPRRRRLHHLIRFMNKIAANHCLRLDNQHSNRYAVLKGLSQSIVPMGTRCSQLLPSQCLHLVTVLVDYEHEIFSVPDGLLSDIDSAVRELRREKVIPTEERAVSTSTPLKDTVQFSNPMQAKNPDQMRHLNENLLELLDQICIDENLSINGKRKRLKKFKRTYPTVYAQRFPSPELTEPKRRERENRFLSKLFGR